MADKAGCLIFRLGTIYTALALKTVAQSFKKDLLWQVVLHYSLFTSIFISCNPSHNAVYLEKGHLQGVQLEAQVASVCVMQQIKNGSGSTMVDSPGSNKQSSRSWRGKVSEWHLG